MTLGYKFYNSSQLRYTIEIDRKHIKICKNNIGSLNNIYYLYDK